MHIKMWSSNSVPNSKTTITSNSIKQKLSLLPKTFQLFDCLHRKKLRLNRDSMKKRRQKTTLRQRNLIHPANSHFSRYLQIVPFFLTADVVKIKSIKATNSVDIGAWPKAIMSTEHAEACQKCANLSRSSPVRADWEGSVGFLQGNTVAPVMYLSGCFKQQENTNAPPLLS